MNWRLADQGGFMGVFRRMFALPLLALFASLLAAAALAQGTPPTPATVISPSPTSSAAPVAATTPAAPTTPATAAATTAAPAKPAPAPRIEFNHNQTGFQLTGGHILARCETCHLQGIFKGTPKDCGSCHTAGGRAATLNTVLKPTNHISVTSGSLCETCHLSTSEFTVWRMDHTLTTAACSSCHSGQSFGGVTFIAKGSQHIFTMADCKICHTSTTSFLPPFVSRYDHIDIAPGDCLRCHNGATAMGKPPAHMPVGARVCDECHLMPPSGDLITTFATWRMDHAGIINGCASCHSGRTYAGVKNSTPKAKPTNHIPVTSDCSVCHYDTTVPGGFVNWSQPMDHSTAAIGTASCATCHGAGKSFIGSPTVVTLPTGAGTHIPTTKTCDTCHYKDHIQPYTSFANWTMDHTGIASGCQACHGTATQLFTGVMNQNAGHPDTTALKLPDCVSCHTVTTPGGFGTFSYNGSANFNPHPGGGANFQNQSRCDNCHGSTGSIKATGMIGGHIPFNSGTDCGACHNSTIASFAKLTLSAGEHDSVTSSSCETCHASGKTYPGLSPQIKTPASVKHIPLSSGAACVPCHSSTSKAVGGFGGRDWTTAMDHSYVNTGTCNTCHAKSVNSTFTSTPPLTIKTTSTQAYNGGGGAYHIPVTGDCAVCHSKTYGVGAFSTSWTMDSTGHGATNTGTCSGCHAKSVGDYVFAPSVPVIGALTTNTGYQSGGTWYHKTAGNAPTVECNSCHGSFTTFLGATAGHKHVAADAGTCKNCHGGTGGGGKGVIPNHIATSASCDACHTTWNTAGNLANETGVFAACSTNPKSCMGAAGHAQVSATCSNCHLSAGNQSITGGTASVTVVGQASGHIPVVNNSACDTCHGKVYTSFARADWKTAMNHSASVITPVRCDVCHSAGADKIYPTGVKVLGALTTPPPPGTSAYHTLSGNAPTADCSDCHGYTTTFGGAVGHTHVAGDAGKCNTCHTGTGGGMTKIANHIATTAASCDVCHTTWGSALPSVTGKFAACSSNANGCMGATGHAAVTGTCNSCHLASGVKSITGGSQPVNIRGVGSVNHIPVVATAVCETCHASAYTSFLPKTGNWASSMVHTSAVIPVTPCSACHGSGKSSAFPGATIKAIDSAGVTHIPVTGDCVACHTTGLYGTNAFSQSWNASNMNHNAVSTGTCNGCHLASAAYKTYTNTTSVNIVGALVPSYAGAGVTFPWHTGSGGTPTTDCYGCHTSFTTFGGATNHVHTSADNSICLNCHNGTGGGGKTKTAGHVGTTTNCYTCHTNYLSNLTFVGQNIGWVMGPAGHAALTTPTACNSCHTGQSFPTGVTPVAKGTSPPHITVLASLQCTACHNTSNNTTTFANVPTFTAAMHSSNGNASAGCSACHNNVAGVAKVFQGVSPKPLPSGHITTTQTCETCHKSTTTFAGQNAGWVMSHTGNSLPCSSCHNGQTFTTAVIPVNVTTHYIGAKPHIPLTSLAAMAGNAGIECSVCHSSTTSFLTEKMNHGTMKGGINPGGCVACHNGTANYLGSQDKKTVGSHEGSKATDDCSKSGCHKPLGTRGTAYTKW